MKNISVIGAGYVGLANALVLAQQNKVSVFEIDKEKIKQLSNGVSTLDEDLAQKLLDKYLNTNLNIFNYDIDLICKSEVCIIALPTDFNEEEKSFNVSTLIEVIEEISRKNPDTVIVVKSTIPVGFCEHVKEKFGVNIFFCPEFLREGSSVEDCINPSRLIIGGENEKKLKLVEDIFKLASNNNPSILKCTNLEAESIKLFSNSYLAIRVAFFNEVDNFALSNDISSENLIRGISLDSRIGDFYNNPSFGFGGYCLPKDLSQAEQEFGEIPQKLFSAAIASNRLRKEFLVKNILSTGQKTVGVYRLQMKKGSDNIKMSTSLDLANQLQSNGIKVIIFEPYLNHDILDSFEFIDDLVEFKTKSDLIIANRITEDLKDVTSKVFTRDVFNQN